MNLKKKSSTAARLESSPSAAPMTPVARPNGRSLAALQTRSIRFMNGVGLGNWGLLGTLQAGILGMALVQSSAAQTSAPSSSGPYDAPTTVRRSPATSDVFVDTAPDSYTVVRGDTLWGIAGRFLKEPWRWPEIWQMNREQIRNPHWIYPGQVIILDHATGTMRLGTGPNANGTVKLSPQVRVEAGRDAIPSIAPEVIEPYLTQPLVVESKDMFEAPRIVAAKERVVLGAGDIAYVAGITDPSITVYQLFRPGRELKDPDSGDVIAYQADYLGTARVTKPGNPATIVITSSMREVNAGDRLVAATKPVVINYMPHAPAAPLTGRVVSIYSGVAYAGNNMIVAINRGAAEGLDVGSILAIKSFGRTIVDRTNDRKEEITLPDERKGLLFIFRVFKHISYGLITSTSDSVEVGDTVTQP
jgi:hypothetical protein